MVIVGVKLLRKKFRSKINKLLFLVFDLNFFLKSLFRNIIILKYINPLWKIL